MATLAANGGYVYVNNGQLFWFLSDIAGYLGLKFIVKTPINIVAGSFPLILQPQNLYNHANAAGMQYFVNANDVDVILENIGREQLNKLMPLQHQTMLQTIREIT
jgi:hypothetical protein